MEFELVVLLVMIMALIEMLRAIHRKDGVTDSVAIKGGNPLQRMEHCFRRVWGYLLLDACIVGLAVRRVVVMVLVCEVWCVEYAAFVRSASVRRVAVRHSGVFRGCLFFCRGTPVIRSVLVTAAGVPALACLSMLFFLFPL